MPINNDLPDIKSPVPDRYSQLPRTNYRRHLQNIKVQLLQSPSKEELLSYIPRWGTATWNDKPHNLFDVEQRESILQDLFDGKILPSAMETIGLVFLISNIDLVDVTHLLRHRTMSFSAICSADRDMRHDDCLLKPSIEVNEEFRDRFLELVGQTKRLYADMVDSGDVSFLDARTILPRCLEHHYYVRVNLKDAIGYVLQRIDRQIQPESDNIVALRMWIEIVKQYPMIKHLIDFNKPDAFYVKVAPTGRSSNIYMPETPRNDVFEYKEQWFMYKCERSQMPGGDVFTELWDELIEELGEI